MVVVSFGLMLLTGTLFASSGVHEQEHETVLAWGAPGGVLRHGVAYFKTLLAILAQVGARTRIPCLQFRTAGAAPPAPGLAWCACCGAPRVWWCPCSAVAPLSACARLAAAGL